MTNTEGEKYLLLSAMVVDISGFEIAVGLLLHRIILESVPTLIPASMLEYIGCCAFLIIFGMFFLVIGAVALGLSSIGVVLDTIYDEELG